MKIDRGLVDQSNMGEALEIASRDIVADGKRILASVTSQEWYVDDLRVLDPIGIRGQVLKMRVHFARLPSVIEDNVITCVESQKRELEDIIFMPLASSLGCLTPEDIELGAAVLDIGRSTTGLAVYRDYRLLGTHCFEWGGYHLTRDVAAGLQVSFEEADELILEYGISDEFVRQEEDDDEEETGAAAPAAPESRSSRLKLKTAVHGAPSIVERSKLDLIIYERAKELLMKVRQHLNARGLSKHLVRGVVLTGGAGAIRNHAALAESIFQVPCRVGIPDSVEILPHSVNNAEFSAAVGIVRHAFEHRAAAKRGRIEPRGSVMSSMRRIGKFLRKYFI